MTVDVRAWKPLLFCLCDSYCVSAPVSASHLSVVCEQREAAVLGDAHPGALPERIPPCQQAGLIRPEVCWLRGPAQDER